MEKRTYVYVIFKIKVLILELKHFFFQTYYEKDVDDLQKYWAPSVITKHGGSLVGLFLLADFFLQVVGLGYLVLSRVAENMQFTTNASGFRYSKSGQ